MSFTRAELEGFRDAVVPDLLGPDLRLLFVGINPGLWTAATGSHFARRGNRFYPALLVAGITDRLIDASAGMSEQDASHLTARGVGISNLAPRATARADELTTAELVEGRRRLEVLVRRQTPRVVAILGITAFRTAFGRRDAVAGRQREQLSGAALWVVPNPSGLNAHETVASLGAAYRSPAEEAGVVRKS